MVEDAGDEAEAEGVVPREVGEDAREDSRDSENVGEGHGWVGKVELAMAHSGGYSGEVREG